MERPLLIALVKEQTPCHSDVKFHLLLGNFSSCILLLSKQFFRYQALQPSVFFGADHRSSPCKVLFPLALRSNYSLASCKSDGNLSKFRFSGVASCPTFQLVSLLSHLERNKVTRVNCELHNRHENGNIVRNSL